MALALGQSGGVVPFISGDKTPGVPTPYSSLKKPHQSYCFLIDFDNGAVTLQNQKGHMQWTWNQFVKFFESPHFFHLYFSPKSFFLVPKDNMDENFRHDLRKILQEKIQKTK